MLVMLLQSIIGLSDDTIIHDYVLSNKMMGGSAIADAGLKQQRQQLGHMDRNLFSGANRQTMIKTLAFLRQKYGSIVPGYVDAIGFDNPWRKRLLACLVLKRSRL